MKKLTIIFLVVFVIFSILVGINIMYKPHKDIAKSNADFQINAKEIFEKFQSNETESLNNYSNKVIESTGKITAIDTENKSIVLDSILFYQFDKTFESNVKVNQIVKIKARLVGYDELMNEIKLDQSTILK
jgi:preprotein translocase subunit SecG